MRRRLFLIALVALALAPGTWWRTALPPASFMPPLTLVELRAAPTASGPFELARAWELIGADPRAGGYSGLQWRGGDRLLAASDNGRLIELDGPDFAEASQRAIFLPDSYDKVSGDVEALAGRGAGPVWAALEGSNSIARASAALVYEGEVRPPALAGWRYNSGPETLVQLRDGRFVAIAEKGSEGMHRGAIFAGDPVADPAAQWVRVAVPAGFRPVDAVAGTDGEVLVLLRAVVWVIPPGFRSAIARYDVADLRAGDIWRPRDHFALPPSAPSDNYEGIALRPENDGTATVWLISDDNLSAFQRSLLIEMRYVPKREKARGSPARPSR